MQVSLDLGRDVIQKPTVAYTEETTAESCIIRKRIKLRSAPGIKLSHVPVPAWIHENT